MASPVNTSVKSVVRRVKPLLSLDKAECRKRVINLYKAWYRLLPTIDRDYELPVKVPQMRMKLHNEFMKHKDVEDIRVIDMLVAKGELELKEIINMHKQTCHIMYYFKDSVQPKPQDFISKFLDGRE